MPDGAVGAVGIPVNEGDAIAAFNNKSFVLDVTRESNPEIALMLDVILAVLELTLVSSPAIALASGVEAAEMPDCIFD